MRQKEISGYLKFITIGIGVLFFVFVAGFLPEIVRTAIADDGTQFRIVCGFLWVTAFPCFLCLWKFWGICVRIGCDQSFSKENALALKTMSYYMLADSVLYAAALVITAVLGWYSHNIGLLFGILLILFVCISFTVLCAALSHLVYKASQMQEEQDLTI